MTPAAAILFAVLGAGDAAEQPCEVARTCLPETDAFCAHQEAGRLREAAEKAAAAYSDWPDLYRYHRLRQAGYQYLEDVYWTMYECWPPVPSRLHYLDELRRQMGDDLYYGWGKRGVPAWPPEKFAGEP